MKKEEKPKAIDDARLDGYEQNIHTKRRGANDKTRIYACRRLCRYRGAFGDFHF